MTTLTYQPTQNQQFEFHPSYDLETEELAGVSFYGTKPLYTYGPSETPVVVHDVWKSGGVSYASVTAAEPIFLTDGRYPDRPTAHSAVPVSELIPLPVAGSPLEEALENWEAALSDAWQLEENEDRANYAAAEQLAQECGKVVAQMVGHVR